MFTGIIEALGIVEEISEQGSNRVFWVRSAISDSLKIDQSLAHDGVCLTIDGQQQGRHRVTAVAETLSKTALGDWAKGTTLNLERSLQVGGRLDGHFVQGHTDCTGICEKLKSRNGSWEFVFSLPKKFAALLIEKGSVAINGTSLTCFDVSKKTFRVAVIPYTYTHTNLQFLKPGSSVNLEFDLIGKYITKQHSNK